MKFNLLPTVARKKALEIGSEYYSFQEESPSGGHMAAVAKISECALFMSTPGDKFVHETIYGGRPMRLVIDLDGSFEGEPTDDEVRQVANRYDSIVTYLLKGFNMEVQPIVIKNHSETLPYMLMSGSRDSKFSAHVLWNVGFETPVHCRGFVEKIIANMPNEENIAIDTNIYRTSGRCSTLRMAYSKKRQVDVLMCPVDFPEFSIEAWAASLVTFHSEMDSTLGLLELPVFVPIALAIPKRIRVVEDDDSITDENRAYVYRQKVLDWLVRTSPSIHVVQQNHSSIQIRVYCRCAMKVHNSNTMYLGTKLDGSVSLYCTSETCKRRVAMLYPDTKAIVANSPVEIDWSLIT